MKSCKHRQVTGNKIIWSSPQIIGFIKYAKLDNSLAIPHSMCNVKLIKSEWHENQAKG